MTTITTGIVRRLVIIGSVFVVLWLVVSPMSVGAIGKPYQPVEWKQYRNGALKYSITFLGYTRGCKPNEPGNYDYKFKINFNASVDPDRLRLYSNDRVSQWIFNGRSPMGVNLLSRDAYLCIGNKDVMLETGPAVTAEWLYVWVD